MKKSCKNIDITNPFTVWPYVNDCIAAHHQRRDFSALVQEHAQGKKYEALNPSEKYDMIMSISEDSCAQIRNRSLILPPITIMTRKDGTTGKIRQIGNEHARQQVFDYIATCASREIWLRRIVPQQASSIKGRGPLYGVNMIRGWVEADNARLEYAQRHGLRETSRVAYHGKGDCQKCYPSGDMDVFLRHFERDCGNADIIWLWEELLASHHVDGYTGFLIGALPSEWAMQYMLSFAYRHIMELAGERRGKRQRWVSHSLFYMDDMLLMGSSRKNLKTAFRDLTEYMAEDLHQTVKPNWSIQAFERHPIDMMGYKVHRSGAVTIRERNFIHARRMVIRCQNNGGLSESQARRLLSYKGYFDHSNSDETRKNLGLDEAIQSAKKALAGRKTGGST